MRGRVLPQDRLRYAVAVAGLLAVYGLLVMLDWVERVKGRRPMMDEGRYYWEENEDA